MIRRSFHPWRKAMSVDLYREAGVDLDKANDLVSRIKPLVRSTFRKGAVSDIGGFGGLFSLGTSDIKNPLLVASTDGVGTKLKIAFATNKHTTVGIDLVAMVVNDIIVQGAKPLFFLDYLAIGHMDLDVVEDIIRGIVAGCKQADCALIGGETAEMPGVYQDGEYDMAGFAVGIVGNDGLVDGSNIRVGDHVIGLASSGLHSNGYSLVRKIVFEKLSMKLDDAIYACRRTVAEELLEPTRIYVKPILRVMREYSIAGMVHVTGGGFYDNIPRILPQSCRASIRQGSWNIPPIFNFLQHCGDIPDEEMYHVFNNGIGFILIVPQKDSQGVISLLNALGEEAYHIGEILPKKSSEPSIEIINR
jgi:phosphoribosylformylglycinamidine cyclo-ligase